MKQNNTIDIKNNSFARVDDAEAMCDLLYKLTGDVYTIASDNHLGFTARRNPVTRDANGFNKVQPPVEARQKEYRQAFRGFLGHYAELGLGILLTTKAYLIMVWGFTWLGIEELPEGFNVALCVQGLRLLGVLLFLYGSRFVYSYFAKKLCFAKDGIILKKGIIAQDQVLIRFGDIKSLGVKQSIVGRLLGIGSLHLDSAATNGDVDIVFDNLVNPVGVRKQILSLIDLHMKDR
jgi:Bacterial PH domain